MVRFTFIDSFIIGWLIYGNHIFIDKSNDCGLKDETKFLYFMMMTVLAFGYLTISVYFAILTSMAFDKIFFNFSRTQTHSDTTMNKLLASLSRI